MEALAVAATIVCMVVALIVLFQGCVRRSSSPTATPRWNCETATLGLMRTLWRLLCWRLWRPRCCHGALTGVKFPAGLDELLGPRGPTHLTRLLRHRGHLSESSQVRSVRATGSDVRDGVKGDKAILELEYVGDAASAPSQLFAKFNLCSVGAMKLLVETSEVCRCEAVFYNRIASEAGAVLSSPKAYFCDHCATTGAFILLSECVRFGEDGVLPAKHRIRDMTTLEEQHLFIKSGASLNAQLWGTPSVRDAPRFDQTHEQMWLLCIIMARLGGLHHTTRRTLKGRSVNPNFMTWQPPEELLGREMELAWDMPKIMASLCDPARDLLAFGHNDLVLDNAFFFHSSGDMDKQLHVGAFDWQQACLNNVGQEWAWNLHWLEPEFLDAHETEFIDAILSTYEAAGRKISRAAFLDSYVLGTSQMYVWGGAGLQMLLGELHARGLFEDLKPNDSRCRDSGSRDGVDEATRQKLVGAEMTRRTFTNCCNIMRRHDFVGAWMRWREAGKS